MEETLRKYLEPYVRGIAETAARAAAARREAGIRLEATNAAKSAVIPKLATAYALGLLSFGIGSYALWRTRKR